MRFGPGHALTLAQHPPLEQVLGVAGEPAQVLDEDVAGDGQLAALKDDLAGVKSSVAAIKSELAAAIASAKVWALLLYAALAAGMFSTMARAFGWI